jgi:hypothetical protein
VTQEPHEILQCRRGEESDAVGFFEHVARVDYLLHLVREKQECAASNASVQDLNNQMRYAYERGRHDAFNEIVKLIESAPRRLAELQGAVWTD